MKQYKILSNGFGIRIIGRRDPDGQFRVSFPENNVDDEYRAWLAAGNEPEPIDMPPSEATIDERLRAAETLINLILSEGE